MFFEPDSVQPNQCISGLHRNKKKFSPDYEVYDGAKKGGGNGCDFLEHYMYLQYASGTSIALFIPVFLVNFSFKYQSCSQSGCTPFRPLFLKVGFLKNMDAYTSVVQNGLLIH